MENKLSFVITAEQAGDRLDKTLVNLMPDLTRNNIIRNIEEGLITVNNKITNKPPINPNSSTIIEKIKSVWGSGK